MQLEALESVCEAEVDIDREKEEDEGPKTGDGVVGAGAGEDGLFGAGLSVSCRSIGTGASSLMRCVVTLMRKVGGGHLDHALMD